MRIAILCADPVYAEGLACLIRHCVGYEVVCCAGHLGGAHSMTTLQPDLLVVTEEFDDRTHRFLIEKLKESGMRTVLLHGENFRPVANDPVFDFSMSRFRGVGAMFELLRVANNASGEIKPQNGTGPMARPERDYAKSGFQFTPREREVAELVSRGLSNKQIASIIGTGEQNVKMYVSRLMRLLGCSNRVQLALLLQPRDTQPTTSD